MLGLNYANLHPQSEPGITNELSLLKSQFRAGHLINGTHLKIDADIVHINHLAHKYGQPEVSSTIYLGDIQHVNHLVKNQPAKKVDHNFFELKELALLFPEGVLNTSVSRSVPTWHRI